MKKDELKKLLFTFSSYNDEQKSWKTYFKMIGQVWQFDRNQPVKYIETLFKFRAIFKHN